MATGGKLGRSQIVASDVFHDFSCTTCSEDGKNTEALFQCTDCQIYYCQRCVSGHNKFTRNHNVLKKSSKLFGQDQRQQNASYSTKDLPTDVCGEHHGEVIKMFCGQHDVVCCIVCIALKHRSCEGVEYIPNIAKGLLKKQNKGKTKASLKKVKDDLHNIKSKLQNKMKKLNAQRDGILDDIQTFKKRIITKIEELERNTIQEVHRKHTKIADEITSSSKKIDVMLLDVEQQLDKLKQVQNNNETQLFVDIKIGEQKISDGSDCARQATAKRTETLVFKVNRRIENTLWSVPSIGILTLRTEEDDFDQTQDPTEKVADRKEKYSVNTFRSLRETFEYIKDPTQDPTQKVADRKEKYSVETFRSLMETFGCEKCGAKFLNEPHLCAYD